MAGQDGSFDTDARLRWLSAAGDPLERLAECATVGTSLSAGFLRRPEG